MGGCCSSTTAVGSWGVGLIAREFWRIIAVSRAWPLQHQHIISIASALAPASAAHRPAAAEAQGSGSAENMLLVFEVAARRIYLPVCLMTGSQVGCSVIFSAPTASTSHTATTTCRSGDHNEGNLQLAVAVMHHSPAPQPCLESLVAALPPPPLSCRLCRSSIRLVTSGSCQGRMPQLQTTR